MSESGVSPLPRGARPYQGQRAGVVTRMVAAGIDGVVVVLFLVIVYAATAVFLFLLSPRTFDFPSVDLVFSMGAAFVVLVVYQTLAWWLTGRTYGGLVMGLRVVSARGRSLSLAVSFARALLSACFPIGILWVAVSRENRSVQDVLLRTSVVYDWQPRGGPNRLIRRGSSPSAPRTPPR